MMQIVNLDFLYVAMAVLLFCQIHYLFNRKSFLVHDRLFLIVLFVGTVDVVLDWCTTLLSNLQDPRLNVLSMLAMTLFYICQVTIPFLNLRYILSLPFQRDPKDGRQLSLFSMCSSAILFVLVLVNLFTGWLFRFDSAGVYCHGPLYLLPYLYAGICTVVAVTYATHFRKRYRTQRFITVWCFNIIAALCVGVQAASGGRLLMTGFGIAMGTLLFYLTLNNPERYQDPMTGAFHLQGFIAWFRKQKQPQHFIFIELIHLKRLNKIHGMRIGDELLLETADLLRRKLNTMSVFQLSGKQMIAVSSSANDCSNAMNALNARFGGVMRIADTEVQCPALVCHIQPRTELMDTDQLVAFCTYISALYEDQHQTEIVQDDTALWTRFVYAQAVEKYLVTAIRDELFELNFQLLWNTAEKRFTSMEVLSRLTHPTLGPISPELFIGLAEQDGSVDEITDLQFRHLCAFLQAHPGVLERLDSIKFNLSPHDLIAHHYEKRLTEIMESYGLPFSKFQFEITESAAVEFDSTLQASFQCFHDKGIALCMDDFGSGYANLNIARRLPFSVIKMDRSLLSDVMTSESAATLYRGLCAMFHSMGYAVVAEGVETAEEDELLTGWHVDYIQGFYRARPVNSAELLRRLQVT